MAETRSAEQVIQEFKQVLGEEFGQLFYALHNDLVWLFVKWQEYQTLFESKPEHFVTMNRTAPFILRIIQRALWENIVLDIARLMDPPQSLGKDNLSVKRIPLFILDKSKQDDISSRIAIAEPLVSFARDWRNRHIAHRDLGLITNTPVAPLADVDKDSVDNSLKAIAHIFAFIHHEYFNTTFFYNLGGYPGGANNLLYYLDAGWSSVNKRIERIRNGTATEEDYNPRRAP